jgi:hypothetical protein
MEFARSREKREMHLPHHTLALALKRRLMVMPAR